MIEFISLFYSFTNYLIVIYCWICMTEEKNFKIVIDIDGVICQKKNSDQDYSELEPNDDILEKLQEYRKNGFYIILFTSRNMNTHNNNLGKINASTAKIIIEWLDKHSVPYDEIYYGKPWCGFKGFYVDDKAIRPDEFITKSYEEIYELVDNK